MKYKQMEFERCGHSGLLLPRISLGLWHNFGSADSYDNMTAMIKTAFDTGITHFDLANNYGPVPGSAESNFGRILRDTLAGHRDELVISTKAGYRMWDGPYGEFGSKKSMLASLDQSLSRMGLDYVDIFYSHRPDPDTPLEETVEALVTAVRQGKALYVGISNYGAERTAQACRLLKEQGIHCLIHQMKYNMLHRDSEAELLPTLAQEGVGSIAFSPLAQGLLSGKYLEGAIPADSRAAKPSPFLTAEQIDSHLLTQLNRLNALAQQRGQTLSQMALAWALRSVTSVLIGCSRPEQLRENMGALNNLDFTPQELAQIDEITALCQR